MSRYARFLQWVAIGFALWPAASWAGEPEKAARLSAEKVAEAIRHLGSVDWETRHAARELLRRAGPAALAALEKCDPALRAPAAEVAEAIRYGFDENGVDDQTPDDVRQLVGLYRKFRPAGRVDEDGEAVEVRGDPAKVPDILEKLAAKGEAGQNVVRAIAAAETDQQIVEHAFAEVGNRLRKRVTDLAADGHFDELEALLRVAAVSQPPERVCDLAAFHLLRGSLARVRAETAEQIDLCARLGAAPFAARAALLLAYLERASGEPAKALETALRWDHKDLASHLAIETGRWQDSPELQEDPDKFADDIGKLGRVAACHRLLGHREAFEAVLRRIAAYGAKVFLLQGRIEEAMRLLRTSKNYRVLVDLLEVQGRFAQAREMAEKAKEEPGGRTQFPWAGSEDWVEPWLAAFQAKLGHRDESRAALGDLAAKALAGGHLDELAAVADQERKAGFEQEAFDHLAAWLPAIPKDTKEYWRLGPFFPLKAGEFNIFRLFLPSHGPEAAAWWPILQKEYPSAQGREAMAHLRELLARKTPEATLAAWLAKADEAAAGLKDDERLDLTEALGDTCALYGQTGRAIGYFRACFKSSVQDRFRKARFLLRAARLHIDEKQWDEAARAFGQAWEANQEDPGPLYLQGWALGKLGREAEGRAKRDLAHLVPLAMGGARYLLAEGLEAFGLAGEARAERQAHLLMGAHDSWYTSYALADEPDRAASAGDYARAALLTERRLMCMYESHMDFLEFRAYLTVPAQVRLWRARARLAEGQAGDALAEALRGLALVPVDLDSPLTLVPEFEKAGHKQEADALFDQVFQALDKACQECPGWAPTHNSLAWMAARCRRRLDAALDHARKAVQLRPACAAYIDTLAEAHFARGEFDKAVEFGQQALGLDPSPYFREQLERFRSGREAKHTAPR